MSFGLLKHLKDTKHGSVKTDATLYTQHVILGSDLGAVLKLLEIKRNFPTDSIKLISPRPFNRQSLVENYEFGVSQLRSEMAVENIYRKFHNAKIRPAKSGASFYKDGKFHEFNGRAKSMELQKGEEFFTHKGFRFDLASFFDSTEWENLDAILNEHTDIRIFEAIEKTTSTELVEKKEWLLTFKDFSSLACESLYVSMSPKKFLNLLGHKETATKELIELCTSASVQAAISVTWNLDKEFFAEEKSLFVPQSMTHEDCPLVT